MVLRLSLVLRQNVLLEPKALQLIDRAVDVLAGVRQRVEAPGGDLSGRPFLCSGAWGGMVSRPCNT